jgi:hypothetical protein
MGGTCQQNWTRPGCVNGINDEHTVEVGRLSQYIVGISNVLVDLCMLPVQDVPQLLKLGWEVLSTVDLILKCMQEAVASGTSPWD